MTINIHEDPNYDGLVRLVHDRNCVAFIGSGLSYGHYLTWERLVTNLCGECSVEMPKSLAGIDADTLLQLADRAKRSNLSAYNVFLTREFGKPIVNTRRAYDLLMRLPFKSYVTPNFDPLLAFESRKPESRCEAVYEYPSLPVHKIERRSVFYIHGYVEPGRAVEDHQLVLGESDFSSAYSEHSLLPGFLRQLLIFHPVFFIGCGLREPTLKPVFDICRQFRKEIEARYSETAPPRYILLPMRFHENPEVGNLVRRDLEAEAGENAHFQSLDINVVRYYPKDKHHSAIEDILEEWCPLPPVKLRSGFPEDLNGRR